MRYERDKIARFPEYEDCPALLTFIDEPVDKTVRLYKSPNKRDFIIKSNDTPPKVIDIVKQSGD
jgi:hypothetical protein